MQKVLNKKLFIYPLVFGILGVLIGLVLRYAYTGSLSGFPFKNVLHSHSHILLLGFLFNALLILVWNSFAKELDKTSRLYYLLLQVCVAIFSVAFIIQGYALYSILFSTIHLWISYILLVRLWKKLDGRKATNQLVKIGIIFHFLSSLGPYILGPLMVLEMKSSPWYQQAIFFYLHFQYFGVLFIWMLALLLNKAKATITNRQIIIITFSIFLLFAHSLDFSFDHWTINIIGGLGSILLTLILLSYITSFSNVKNYYRYIYYIILSVALLNIIGSFPYVADKVVQSRSMLIAWLHLLFLGMYTPFIWLSFEYKIKRIVWLLYAFFVIFSEAILIFPAEFSAFLSTSIVWLLLYAYMGISVCIVYAHFKFLLNIKTTNA